MTLPDSVRRTLEEFSEAFDLSVRLVRPASDDGSDDVLYTNAAPEATTASRTVAPRDGPRLVLEIVRAGSCDAERVLDVLAPVVEQGLDAARELEFFTTELSERYEEISLLYSISETLGSTLKLEDAARVILGEVCDTLGARRGSLWVYAPEDDLLRLVASVGEEGRAEPIGTDDPVAVSAYVFREGRPIIASRRRGTSERAPADGPGESLLSVPIRYTPPTGDPRTVGVINLIGRREGERFTAGDQKLLSAIASQVGAALENNRLIRQSLSRERMAREMELAHNLQMTLLPAAERFEAADVAARVEPAAQVGGDFYQLFKLPDARVGVMLGDVSQHGFPAALMMTLTMSAAGIYAREVTSPARVLRDLDDALAEELETTEMFLTVLYIVLDPLEGRLTYANAGHPHAFVIRCDGRAERLLATDPPMGFAGPDSYSERALRWQSGEDLLLLFTDGLSDALASKTRNDGEEKVLQSVIAHRRESPLEIVDALFEMTASAEPAMSGDDRTALVLRT